MLAGIKYIVICIAI